MFSLWHPLRDPHHCSFRMLTLLLASEGYTLSSPRLSILDLLFLFPQYIGDIRMVKKTRSDFRNLLFPQKNDSYVYLPSVQLIYRELQTFQKTALEALVARGLLYEGEFNKGKAVLNIEKLPNVLMSHIESRIKEADGQISFLIGEIGRMNIDGPDSLLRNLKLEMGGRFK